MPLLQSIAVKGLIATTVAIVAIASLGPMKINICKHCSDSRCTTIDFYLTKRYRKN